MHFIPYYSAAERLHKSQTTEQSGTQTVPVDILLVSHWIKGYQEVKCQRQISNSFAIQSSLFLVPGRNCVSHRNFRRVIGEGYKIKRGISLF